jgi:hypothetical protein
MDMTQFCMVKNQKAIPPGSVFLFVVYFMMLNYTASDGRMTDSFKSIWKGVIVV